jgi:dTDP-4-amino-4,6-dideoxygalactose transaminase
MIPITKPFLGQEEVNVAQEVIRSGWITQGPKVKAFEDTFAQAIGSRFACAVSNCTTAIHLALLATGVKPGDVVITVSHSFIATANVIRHCGAEPVFVDIDPDTYNMDTRELLRTLSEDCIRKDGNLYYKDINRITTGESPLRHFNNKSFSLGRVAAVLPVHQMGIPCDMGGIVKIAEENGLPVVEDAACAVGSELSLDCGKTWEWIGKPHGDIACFSFHPRKLITTGEGGMITTNDDELDAKCRLLRQHGMNIPDTVRHESPEVIFESYLTTGFNYRMTDIQAAIGIEQLKKLNGIVNERRELALAYKQLLGDIPHLKLVNDGASFRSNWQSYPIRFLDEVSLNQKEIMQRLLNKGISTRRGIMNSHQEPAYQAANWSLPKSEECRDRTILIPLFNGIGIMNIEYIASTLRKLLI